METKQKQRLKSYHLKLKYSHVRKRRSMVSLKRCLCFARRKPLNLVFSEDDCHPTLYSFTNMAGHGWEHMAAVVFVSNKFVSSCVICLVSALEKFKLNEHRGCYWRKKLLWMIFEEQFPVPRYISLQVKWVIASFRCYDNSDAFATLIITNFHLHLIQPWW